MMAFLILHIALSGRFSFGSRHGLRPSGPRTANLAPLKYSGIGIFFPHGTLPAVSVLNSD